MASKVSVPQELDSFVLTYNNDLDLADDTSVVNTVCIFLPCTYHP